MTETELITRICLLESEIEILKKEKMELHEMIVESLEMFRELFSKIDERSGK